MLPLANTSHVLVQQISAKIGTLIKKAPVKSVSATLKTMFVKYNFIEKLLWCEELSPGIYTSCILHYPGTAWESNCIHNRLVLPTFTCVRLHPIQNYCTESILSLQVQLKSYCDVKSYHLVYSYYTIQSLSLNASSRVCTANIFGASIVGAHNHSQLVQPAIW